MRYTAVVRDNYGTHVIKTLAKDETHLYFQVYNKDKNIYSPCFLIPANYGTLPYYPLHKKKSGRTKKEHDIFYEELNNDLKYTKNTNRLMLTIYYNQFLLTHLISTYHKN